MRPTSLTRIQSLAVFLILLLPSTTWGADPMEPNVPCGAEEIDACYKEAVELFKEKDYEAARGLFERIVAINVKYKKAPKYLKKCQIKITEAQLAEKGESQRLEGEAKFEKKQKAKKRDSQIAAELEKEEEAKRLKELEGQIEPGPEMIPVEPAEAAGAPEEPVKPQQISYRIGIGDVLEISVWRNTDLDKNVIVRPDGVISYPLIGDIPAVGLSLTELDDRITEALTDYVRNPVVSVAVQRFGGTKVVILGEVKTPGVYSPPGGGNIIDVIALAGGFTDHAVKRGTFLIRGGLAAPEVYRLNLARVFKGDLSQNLSVQSNDIIYVPKRFIANWNYVMQQISPTLSTTLLGTSVARDIKNLR